MPVVVASQRPQPPARELVVVVPSTAAEQSANNEQPPVDSNRANPTQSAAKQRPAVHSKTTVQSASSSSANGAATTCRAEADSSSAAERREDQQPSSTSHNPPATTSSTATSVISSLLAAPPKMTATVQPQHTQPPASPSGSTFIELGPMRPAGAATGPQTLTFLPPSSGATAFQPYVTSHGGHQYVTVPQVRYMHGPPPGAGFAPLPAQPPPSAAHKQEPVPSPKATASATPGSMGNRAQRCGSCKGCTSNACGVCLYCRDSPQYGGPGVKKQSCVERRCHRVLELKLQRDAGTFRAKRGCNQCDECRHEDCYCCLVCFDRKFFDNRYLPGAMCARKRCSNATPLERHSPVSSNGSSTPGGGHANAGVKRRHPSPGPQHQHVGVGSPHHNGHHVLTKRTPGSPVGNGIPLQMSHLQQQLNGTQQHILLTAPPPQSGVNENHHPITLHPQLYATAAGHPGAEFHVPNGMHAFPANFLPLGAASGVAAPFAHAAFGFAPMAAAAQAPPSFPAPLQPTRTSDTKTNEEGGADRTDDPYEPPSYNAESKNSVVLQSL